MIGRLAVRLGLVAVLGVALAAMISFGVAAAKGQALRSERLEAVHNQASALTSLDWDVRIARENQDASAEAAAVRAYNEGCYQLNTAIAAARAAGATAADVDIGEPCSILQPELIDARP